MSGSIFPRLPGDSGQAPDADFEKNEFEKRGRSEESEAAEAAVERVVKRTREAATEPPSQATRLRHATHEKTEDADEVGRAAEEVLGNKRAASEDLDDKERIGKKAKEEVAVPESSVVESSVVESSVVRMGREALGYAVRAGRSLVIGEGRAHDAFVNKVECIPFTTMEDLVKHLEPGDIFLTYCPANTDPLTAAIRAVQNAGKWFMNMSTNDSHNVVHASLYVGDGMVSEAVDDGIRLNSLLSDRVKLTHDRPWGYLVYRPTNRNMALEACQIARELSAKHKDEPTTYKYAARKALFSGISEGKLDKKGIVRYLKGACYAFNKIQPMSKTGIRDFFCSYFVGWACQAGESLEILAKVNESLAAEDKIVFPDLTGVPKNEQGQVLSKWANAVADKHEKLFKENIKLDFDPKLTSPQRMFIFFLEHPELFSPPKLIFAPKVAPK